MTTEEQKALSALTDVARKYKGTFDDHMLLQTSLKTLRDGLLERDLYKDILDKQAAKKLDQSAEEALGLEEKDEDQGEG